MKPRSGAKATRAGEPAHRRAGQRLLQPVTNEEWFAQRAQSQRGILARLLRRV